MKIAANYSEHLLKIMSERPDVVVKVSDWNSVPKVERTRALFPEAGFLVHSTLVLGSGTPVDRAGLVWRELVHLVRLARPPYLSAHIGYNCQVDYAPSGEYVFGQRLTEDEIVRNIVENVRLLRDAFGLEIILENQVLVYGGGYVPPFMEGCASPRFIRRVVEATDCGLLYDVAHGRVTAAFLDMAEEAYIDAAPLERLREVHLSGCRMNGGHLSDDHETMEARDYELLNGILRRCRPEFLTLEYDKDEAGLRRQLDRLSDFVIR